MTDDSFMCRTQGGCPHESYTVNRLLRKAGNIQQRDLRR